MVLFGDTMSPDAHEVDMHILEASEAEPFWMDNLHLRKTGTTLKYIFVRADRSFYMTGVTLSGNGKIGPQAVRVIDGIQALIAGVLCYLVSVTACATSPRFCFGIDLFRF